jgi:GDPmannose 4,6-dehydratase
MIMNATLPEDYVVATEEYHSVREFAEHVFKRLNLNMDDYIKTKETYFRPNEVPALKGDATKIRDTLGWKPTVSFDELIEEMISSVMDEEKDKKYLYDQTEQKRRLSDG